MKLGKTIYVTTRDEWRAWLVANHDKEPEIWLITYKKHTARTNIPYNDAVEEALCFGWIDSTVKTVDADSYAQRYSPRKKASKWSETNKKRIRRLVREGKMTPAGMEVVENVIKELVEDDGTPHDSNAIAADFLSALKENEVA